MIKNKKTNNFYVFHFFFGNRPETAFDQLGKLIRVPPVPVTERCRLHNNKRPHSFICRTLDTNEFRDLYLCLCMLLIPYQQKSFASGRIRTRSYLIGTVFGCSVRKNHCAILFFFSSKKSIEFDVFINFNFLNDF